MIVKALCNFKHEKFNAEAGKSYEVPEQLAFYFINCGWCEGPDGERVATVPTEHIIEVDNVQASTSTSNASVTG